MVQRDSSAGISTQFDFHTVSQKIATIKPEPIFIISGINIPITIASESVYNFASNRKPTYCTLQFLR